MEATLSLIELNFPSTFRGGWGSTYLFCLHCTTNYRVCRALVSSGDDDDREKYDNRYSRTVHVAKNCRNCFKCGGIFVSLCWSITLSRQPTHARHNCREILIGGTTQSKERKLLGLVRCIYVGCRHWAYSYKLIHSGEGTLSKHTILQMLVKNINFWMSLLKLNWNRWILYYLNLC